MAEDGVDANPEAGWDFFRWTEGDGLVMVAVVVVVVAVRIIRDRPVSHCGEKESGGVPNSHRL